MFKKAGALNEKLGNYAKPSKLFMKGIDDELLERAVKIVG
jgi:hypothetical protein